MRRILFWLLGGVLTFYSIALRALDWLGRLETANQSYRGIGGWQAVIAFLLSPPNWFAPAISVIGIVLLLYLYLSGKKLSWKTKRLPIGSLVFESGTMEIYHSVSKNETAGKLSFQIKNTTNELITFEALLFGDINGSQINSERSIFKGYIYPNTVSLMISAIAKDIKIDSNIPISEPVVIGRLTYSIKYKANDDEEYYRETANTLIYESFNVLPNIPTTTCSDLKIRFSASKEI